MFHGLALNMLNLNNNMAGTIHRKLFLQAFSSHTSTPPFYSFFGNSLPDRISNYRHTTYQYDSP